MNKLQKFVFDRLQELELGAVEAATSVGIERTFVRDIVEDKKKSVRTDKLDHLAKALRLPVERVMEVVGIEPPEVRMVKVGAHVQAGNWVESWEWPEADQYAIAVPNNPALKNFRLYAAETLGPSMNKRWPEGTVVVFTNAAETMESPIPGKRYVIERKRSSGEAEHTVKLLHVDENGKFWLIPESHDPLHQQPISIEDGLSEGDEITIIGRVWYAVTRE